MWKRGYKPIVLITTGDTAGIGPEVIAKTLAEERIRKLANIFVIGSAEVLTRYTKSDFIRVVERPEGYSPNHINVIDIGPGGGVEPGKPTYTSAKHALLALERATAIIKEFNISCLVTAPIYKKGINEAGFPFPGHTEFLGERFGSPVLMSFWGRRLKVATITTHIPLKEVPKAVTEERIREALRITFESLTKIFKRSPKVGLLGLNPHAGEEGLLGDEEVKLLKPICEEFQKRGYHVEGPLPADSAFYLAYRGAFDIVLGLYHDQVLSPYKMLYFHEGVNVTLGLPFIRTSPDHGTAFDIAGKGIASERSFKNALLLAIKLSKKWE